ncbi:MAG: hypothetical protein M1830_006751 [Pleopsidium flavum]|nr:MAG: hypothetical protein M1830_006751 [Pleopsidium flavum]
MATTTSAAAGLLGRQFKQMQTDKDIPGISCGLVDNNVFEWEVMLMISDDCKYYGEGNPGGKDRIGWERREEGREEGCAWMGIDGDRG